MSHRSNSKTHIMVELLFITMVLTTFILSVFAIEAKAEDNTDAISYLYPVYNTENDPKSGIKEWKEGSVQSYSVIGASDTTLGKAGTTTWYVVNSEAEDNLTISNTVTVYGDVNIILVDGAKLIVKGELGKAGINVSGTDNSLTIYGQEEGNGLLTVNGGDRGAAIGGGSKEDGNNITINGGTVIATQGNNAAGIGGGLYGNGDNITINGGTVTAKGYFSAIGAGFKGKGSNITIASGLFVMGWKMDSSMNLIESSGKTITLGDSSWDEKLFTVEYVYIAKHTHSFADGWSSNEVSHWHECTAEGASDDCTKEAAAAKVQHDAWENGICMTCGYECKHSTWEDGICKNCGYECTHGGDIKGICSICGIQIITPVSYLYPMYNIENNPKSGIREWKEGTTLSWSDIGASTTTLGEEGKTTWYVVDSKAADNLTISNSIIIKGNVNIILEDGAKLIVKVISDKEDVGIKVADGNSLTIYGQSVGSGELSVTGDTYGAGIGGGFEEDGGNITINGGTVNAKGGSAGAGIGGGYKGKGSNIIINGGFITAEGGKNGAGIGNGFRKEGSNIIINGGTVTAKGGQYGAGIGGGGTNASNITIASELLVRAGSDKTSAEDIIIDGTDAVAKVSGKNYVYVVRTGAVYSGCSLSLSGDIGINIFMKIDADVLEDSEAKLVIKNGDAVTEIPLANAQKVELSNASDAFPKALIEASKEEASDSEYYIFNCSVPAKDYSNKLTCQFVRKAIEGRVFTVSVSEYITYIQNNSSKYDEKTVAFACAMERYCAAAEDYFAADGQAEQQAKYDYSAIAGKLSSYSADSSKMGESYLGTSLILNGKVAVRHYYSDSAVFTKIGVTGYKSAGDMYYYEIENISPADYDEKQSNGYSVYSYILAGISSDEGSNSLKNLLCAMYELGVAAEKIHF